MARKFRQGDSVHAARDLEARTSSDVPLPGSPPSHTIPKGTLGIFHGKVLGEPDLVIVRFRLSTGVVRVEVALHDITA